MLLISTTLFQALARSLVFVSQVGKRHFGAQSAVFITGGRSEEKLESVEPTPGCGWAH
jgi:hypothetical protein